ncbi:hypothetical protein DERP_013461 [Dermatophagoides pteronyssinus]|uniref:Uncharacterized protein n=1 Tax=Dermatophagoides pteronyssinus TaxID=6956 RepID=A0ABQ8JRM9_DERPT|nr:hypothetical protein DERP_013461 [Dermatophagoides pteronyssinus]
MFGYQQRSSSSRCHCKYTWPEFFLVNFEKQKIWKVKKIKIYHLIKKKKLEYEKTNENILPYKAKIRPNHCHHHHYYITMGKNGYLDYHLVLSPPQQQQQTADNKDSMSRFS